MFVIVSLIYLIIATVVVVKVRGWIKKTVWAIAFALIPTWDILLAEVYMRYRCRQDAGVRVHEMVTVKESELVMAKCIEKKDYMRVVKELSKDYHADCLYLPYRYGVVFNDHEPLMFGVFRLYDSFADTNTGKLLGERIGYGYTSGWIISSLGYRGWSGSCPPYQKGEWQRFFDSIFQIDWQH